MQRRHATALALALLAWAPTRAPAQEGAPADAPQGFVTIAGEGVAYAMADTVSVRLVVATQGASPRQAFEANAARVAAVVEAAGAAGVAQSQIRSEKLQAGAPAEAGAKPTFQVRHVLVARVRGLARLGDLMERAAAAGASEVSGLEFGPEEAASAARDARTRAAKDAEERARAYAQGLGLRLGRVVSVNDAAPPEPRPPSDPGQPVEAGRSQVRARVTVVWEIEPAPPPRAP